MRAGIFSSPSIDKYRTQPSWSKELKWMKLIMWMKLKWAIINQWPNEEDGPLSSWHWWYDLKEQAVESTTRHAIATTQELAGTSLGWAVASVQMAQSPISLTCLYPYQYHIFTQAIMDCTMVLLPGKKNGNGNDRDAWPSTTQFYLNWPREREEGRVRESPRGRCHGHMAHLKRTRLPMDES